MKNREWESEKTSKDLIVGVLLAMAAVGAGILILSVPLEGLWGEGVLSYRSAFHGLFAGIFMVTATIGLYQGFRLWIGTTLNVKEMEVGSLLNAAVCFLTLLLGNWMVIPYRGPGGPRQSLLENLPAIHTVFFEFKSFTALFTLPLAVGAAYLICRYGERLMENEKLRDMAALLLVLNFFYFIIAFGLGAAITKLVPV